MNFHLIALPIIALSILTLGILAYVRDRKSITNKTFFFAVLFLTTWIVVGGYGTNSFPFFLQHPLLWNRITMTLSFLMGLSFTYFSFVFPNKYALLQWHKKLWLALGFLLAPTTLFTDLVIKRAFVSSQNLILSENGTLSIAYTGWSVVGIIIVTSLLFRNYRKSKGLAKSQFRYVFLGIFLFASINLVSNLVMPLFGYEHLFNFGLYASLFLVACIAYAIIKHRLMDIRLVILRSVLYSCLIGAVGVLYVLVIVYARSPLSQMLGISSNVMFVMTGFLIAFGFSPLKRLTEKATDGWLYKGRYNPNEVLAELSDITSSTIVLDSLSQQILETLFKEIRLEGAAFYLKGKRKDEIKQFGFVKLHIKKSYLKTISKDMMVADELEDDKEEKQELREARIAVILPLLMEEKLVGHLVLGEKKSGDMYNLQDLNFLKVFSSQAAVALHNALLFTREQKKVTELNALNELSSSLVKTLHLQSLLDQVIGQALLVTKAQSGSIMLLDEASRTLSINTSQGISSKVVKKTEVQLGEGIAGYVAETGKPLILSKNQKTPFKEELKRGEISSSLTVPLKTKKKTIGVLNINRKLNKEPFLEEDLNLLSSFAAQAATAIENARLYTQAITDGLTKLYNHPYFQLKLSQEIAEAERSSLPLSLLMIDIDHFKKVNDTYGHQKGDLVLKEIAKLLKKNIPRGGLPARYGGEEFAVILPLTELKEATDVAEDLRKNIQQFNFGRILVENEKITVSIGVSSLLQAIKGLQEKQPAKDVLIRKADEALYLAKQSGRNKVKPTSASNTHGALKSACA